MGKHMGKVNTKPYRELIMMEIDRMINQMDLAKRFIKMVVFTKATTKMAKKMDLVSLRKQMVLNIKEISKQIRLKEKANIFGKMEEFMKANGRIML